MAWNRTLAVAVALSTIGFGKEKPSQPATAPVGAAPPTVPTGAPTTAPPRPRETINLLLHTKAEITLSSRVDNPRDFPEHLVDGKPATAWNGKTGDRNAWIEVKLDPRVHVDAVLVTAGFDHGDLFEKNLRVTKLRVTHDGTVVRDVDLDPNERGLQRIAIDRPGGTLKLAVLESAPGTKKEWQEIVVSELKVLGSAPSALVHTDARLPAMKIAPGSEKPPLPADLDELEFEGREGPNLDAICKVWSADVLTVAKRQRLDVAIVRGFLECGATKPPPLEDGPLPLGWTVEGAIELRVFNGVVVRTELYLLLKRPDGVLVAGPQYSIANDVGDAPWPGYWRMGMTAAAGQRLLRVAFAGAWHSPYESSEMDTLHVEHAGRVCRFEEARVTCAPKQPTIFAVDRLDGAGGAAFKAAPRAKLPTLDARGQLIPWNKP